MLKRVLISDPDESWSNDLRKFLVQNNLEVSLSKNGKDCQLQMYKNPYDFVILDLATTQHSSLEVLKYLKLNFPTASIVLTTPSGKGIPGDDLKKLGVKGLFMKPYDLSMIMDCLESRSQFSSWQNIICKDSKSQAEKVQGDDKEFSEIDIRRFTSSSVTILDYYLKLGAGKYVKILHQGDTFHPEFLEKLIKEKNVTHLYFRTKDRGLYINYTNELLAQQVDESNRNTRRTLRTMEEVVDKYLEEIYSSGLSENVVEEGLRICNSMYKLIMREKQLGEFYGKLDEAVPGVFTQQFLTALYAVIIAQKLDWATKRTVDYVTMASLLHGIGMLKIPQEISNKKRVDLSEEELKLYDQYPTFGFEILSQFSMIPEPVRQIVYQHRELTNGSGFPNGLTMTNIYPLAKIVAVARAYTTAIIEENLSPIDALRFFMSSREIIETYDPACIKALITSFIRNRRVA